MQHAHSIHNDDISNAFVSVNPSDSVSSWLMQETTRGAVRLLLLLRMFCIELVVHEQWSIQTVPNGGTLNHLMWTFVYVKTYDKWKTMRKLTRTDPKTLQKWINLYWNEVSLVESDVVSHCCRNHVFLITIISKHSPLVCSWYRLFVRINSKMINWMTALFQ
jgi:hypothetical protein